MNPFFSGHKIPERELQALLESHPYLIDRDFFNKPSESQKFLKSGIADIVVYLDDEIVVTELKVVPLTNQDVLQLNGYLEDIQEQMPGKLLRGILIGEEPKDNVHKLLKSLVFPIEVKILKTDIPIFVKICRNCRNANPMENSYCDYCDGASWL